MFHFSWATTNFLLLRVMAWFSVENILSHSAENFVGDPFGLSLISVIEKCKG